MAVTGLIMVGFLIGHVSGNLLVFRGPGALNHYAAFLKELGGFLWLARAILLASVVLHIVAAIQLTQLAHAGERSRPHHRGRRLHLGKHRRCARRECDPRPQARRGRRNGCRGVHRVWGMRGGVPERRGVALHGGQDLAPWVTPTGTAGTLPARARDGRANGRRGVRRLHMVWRVPGRVPEGDQHRHDRAHESRLLERDDEACIVPRWRASWSIRGRFHD